ncbi:hypothetical protein XALC_1625 [Xanthomonas albilineans GPE PC73]|uniref:Uncharacterized protein n=3 Tax=Xanthomonas albilineans TaxID=29447 RepID=D2UDS5_XANAP|nr:hypothetical protein XaFJ1_GM001612 [Xanthomonas albilineans]CBA16124.1 hypothetical protein XALC_1625 [Xanthomonas albilineans GPE PC73]
MHSMSVTFDSNVWESIVVQDKLEVHHSANSLRAIRDAIESKRIAPYILDSVVTLESLRKSHRKDFLGGIKIISRRQKEQVNFENGVNQIEITCNIISDYSHFPSLHPKLEDALGKARKLGFLFINVPRIAAMRLPYEWYKPQEATDSELSERLDRTFKAVESIESLGLGGYQIQALGANIIKNNPSQRLQPYMIAAAEYAEEKELSDAVAEWVDGDAIAAHYGHGNDVFCTLDFGRNAGFKSVLHASRRDWLRESLGVLIATPDELANIIEGTSR